MDLLSLLCEVRGLADEAKSMNMNKRSLAMMVAGDISAELAFIKARDQQVGQAQG